MYIEPHILLILIVGAIVLYLTTRTKANKYQELSFGIEDLVKYVRRFNSGVMLFHNIVYDEEIDDYFLVLYDKHFDTATIKLSSVNELTLDLLNNETNLAERKKRIINLILQEVSYRIDTSTYTDGVTKHDDRCSKSLEKELKNQIINKKEQF